MLFVKSRGVDPGGVVQPFMDWVGNERVEINWEISALSSPFTVANSIKTSILLTEYNTCITQPFTVLLTRRSCGSVG